jgi:peptidyl-Lys metalloendopeptidase
MKFTTVLASSAILASPALAAFTVTYSEPKDLKFKATVTSDKDVTILQHPNSVAAPEFDTDIFTFESEDGKSPKFNGIALKWDTGSGKKLALKAGQPVVFEQDVSKSYTFAESTYKIGGGNLFYVVSPSGDVTTETAKVVSTTAKFSGGAEARKRDHTPVYGSLAKRATYRGCTAAQQAETNEASREAQAYITGARAYMLQHTAASPRWTWWFGPFTTARYNTVIGHYANMINDPFNVRYDCSTCPTGANRDAYAYVYPNDPSTVYLCAAYWRAPRTGTDSKAGTIVHELSHFNVNGGTRDYAYGQAAAHALATGSAAQAIMNADTHEYFAENTPSRA